MSEHCKLHVKFEGDHIVTTSSVESFNLEDLGYATVPTIRILLAQNREKKN
jgi:hypothetical protein